MDTIENADVGQMRSESRGAILFQGIAAIILGFLLISAPEASLTVLVTFLGIYWLASGIVGIVKIFTGTASRNWFWAAVVGALGIFAGLVVLDHPLWSSLLVPAVVIVVLGIDALLMGVVNFVRGVSGEGIGYVAIAILDLVFGFILLASPVIVGSFLPVVLGFFALFLGVSMVILALAGQRRFPQEETSERETERAA